MASATAKAHGAGISAIRVTAVCTLILAVLFLFGCGNPIQSILDDIVRGDTSKPAVKSIDPLSGSRINGSTVIRIIFDESMDTDTLNLTGPLASESDWGAWSKDSVTDDMLLIGPQPSWTEGDSRTLVVDCCDSAGNDLDQLTLTYTVDATAPTAGEAPTNGSTISAIASIVVQFDETMAPGSLVLGGDLTAESDGGTWSQSVDPNDTLTIGPAPLWSGGSGKTLTVDCSDLAGNSIATLNLTYTVDPDFPFGTESPSSGSTLATGNSITITFNKKMKTTSLQLVGTLLNPGYTSSWNTPTETILTISPATTWNDGPGQTLVVDCDDTVDNPIAQMNLTYSVDGTGPAIASQNPTNNAVMSHTNSVAIVFDESINTGAFSTGGTIGSASVSWSQTSNPDDTATLSPATTWNAGSDRSLTIGCEDLHGNTANFNLSYDVLAGIVYVSASGNDSNPATATQPKLTLNAAINLADSLFTTAEVRVAQGTYNVTWPGSHVVMKEGVSLYGGYSTNFSARNPATYVTTIQDNSTAGGSSSNPSCAVGAGSGVTTSTVIDGFTIVGGQPIDEVGPEYGAAVCCSDGAPTIENNVIDGGGSLTGGEYTHGILAYGASDVVIKNNTIDAGEGKERVYAVYVEYADGSVAIENNDIDRGAAGVYGYGTYVYYCGQATIDSNYIESTSTQGGPLGIVAGHNTAVAVMNNVIDLNQSFSYGIQFSDNGSSSILNNTIDCGSKSNSYGIRLGTGSPRIQNNIIITAYMGIRETDSLGNPSHVQNNDIYDVNYFYYDVDEGAYITSIGDMETDLQAEGCIASGNVSANPVFNDRPNDDYHLTASSPASVRNGGVVLYASDFTHDKDGSTRPEFNNWSMGAYEQP